ncbi:MAG: hypothetical protein KAT43_04225 [Nanoarchaeota archaeon]|nr:hypothetical protein [Nanoarchaeota archaeon]
MLVLDLKGLLKSYQNRIPNTQLNILSVRNWLPLYLNSSICLECAYLIGKIMGDGNLDKKFTIRLIGQQADLEKIKEMITQEFKISHKRLKINFKQAKGDSYMLQINDALLGRLLSVLGAPIGAKVKNDFLIPKWISFTNDTKRAFLQGILEDELSTVRIEKSNYSTKPIFKMAKIEERLQNLEYFLKQIKNIIESMGVECGEISRIPKHLTDRKDNLITYSKHFWIQRNKQNILRFSHNIGFRYNLEKVKKLKKLQEALNKDVFKYIKNENRIL